MHCLCVCVCCRQGLGAVGRDCSTTRSSHHRSFIHSNPAHTHTKIQPHDSPKAAAALEGLDLAGRVGQMLHLSVKKTLFDYPNDPYVDKAKVTDWLNQVQVGTITNTPFDGQRGGPNQTITGWNVTEWRTALRRIQVGWWVHWVALLVQSILSIRSFKIASMDSWIDLTAEGSPVSYRPQPPSRTSQEAAKDAGHPPILYGIDHLHGANYVMGATLFPQQINVAASFDRAHAEAMGRVMAKARVLGFVCVGTI